MTVDFSRFQLVPNIQPSLDSLVEHFDPQRRALVQAQIDKSKSDAGASKAKADRQKMITQGAAIYNKLRATNTFFDRDLADADETNIYNKVIRFLGEHKNTGLLDEEDTQQLVNLASHAQDNPAGAVDELKTIRENLGLMEEMTQKSLATLDPDNYAIDVQKAEILEDGTIIFANNNQTRTVLGPGGDTLTGSEASDAFKRSAKFKAESKGLENALKVASTYAGTVFEKAPVVEEQIATMEEAVRLIEQEGASSGIIQDKLPAFRSATIQLRNLKNRLGLGVIQSVTFGSLSKGELEIAMSTAVPPNLNEKELAEFFKRKIAAQRKVLASINELAGFLGSGDKTIPQWIEYKKSLNKEAGNANQKETRNGKPVIRIPLNAPGQ